MNTPLNNNERSFIVPTFIADKTALPGNSTLRSARPDTGGPSFYETIMQKRDESFRTYNRDSTSNTVENRDKQLEQNRDTRPDEQNNTINNGDTHEQNRVQDQQKTSRSQSDDKKVSKEKNTEVKEENTVKSKGSKKKSDTVEKTEEENGEETVELNHLLFEKLSTGEELTENEKATLKKQIDSLLNTINDKLSSAETQGKDKIAFFQNLKLKLKQLALHLSKDENSKLQNLLEKDPALLKQIRLVKQSSKSQQNDTAGKVGINREAVLNTEVKSSEQNETTVKPGFTVQNSESQSSFDNNANGDDTFSFNRESRSVTTSKSLIQNAETATSKNTLFKDQINKLMEQARITVIDKKNGSLNLKLYPERLGNVNVQLGLENGTLTGKFLVESREAKDALMANLDQLKEDLAQNGVEVGAFEVNVKSGNQSFAKNQHLEEIISFDSKKKEKAAVIASEYEIQSAHSHDGNLNLVI